MQAFLNVCSASVFQVDAEVLIKSETSVTLAYRRG